ncbi:MAG: sugar phosphate isomerase/epimerase [Bacteroidales bacterium]|nr:sugar phosphate isomerase/epimerase [Bacteroidales bacterium]MCF8389400.1 sugar phosphate isomerase/epimerase [Bacteroidales bacterium]
MKSKNHRRNFASLTMLLGLIFVALTQSCNTAEQNANEEQANPGLRNKIALNAYSFNNPLKDGSMDLFDVLSFCSELGIEAADLTGYYFPGYPAPPSDEYIYSIKKRAFELGLDICGTGVKNDFCYADPEQRKKEKELVKNWIIVAEKLGAPAIRIFTGKAIPENYSWDEVAKWVAEDIIECAEFGKAHGVMIEVQNHNDFLKTAKEVSSLLELINHEWVGLMLDIGCYRTADPYIEIAQTIKYAINWQLKENVFINQVETPVDLNKIKDIIANSDYKGYLPIETLGAGDPIVKVEKFYKEVIAGLK